MSKLIEYFIRRSFHVHLFVFFIIVVGLISLSSMKRDLVPSFQFNTILVKVILVGASPSEIEKFITYPLEEQLSSVANVEDTESNSYLGQSLIRVNFPYSVDIDTALAEVKERVSFFEPQLPSEIKSINISLAKNNSIFLAWINITDFDIESVEHRKQLHVLEKKIMSIKGITTFSPNIPDRDIYIRFNLEQMSHKNIKLNEVQNILRQHFNLNVVGAYDSGITVIPVKINDKPLGIETLEALPVKVSASGYPVLLKEVAKVSYQNSINRVKTFTNNKPSIGVLIKKGLNSDTIIVAAKVQKVIDAFNANSKDLKIVPIVKGDQFLVKQLEILRNNGLLGILIVFLVLVLFLNWRVALIVSLGLPVAYLGTITILSLQGIFLNLISIIGMILVLGILVDDAIIISERYTSLLDKGLNSIDAAKEAVTSMFIPVSGSILTTIIAFTPLLFIKSQMSIILMAIPIVVISTILISWVEAFFILPNHLAHYVKKPQKVIVHGLMIKIENWYVKTLKLVIKFRYFALIAFIGLLALSGYIGVKKMKHKFNLNIRQEKLSIKFKLKNKKSIDHTKDQIMGINDFAMKLNSEGVTNIVTRIGKVWLDGVREKGVHVGKVDVFIDTMYSYPKKIKEKIKSKVDQYIEDNIDRSLFEKLVVGYQSSSDDEEKNDVIKFIVKGSDELDFSELQTDLTTRLKQVKGFSEVVVDPEKVYESWNFLPDNKQLLQYGISRIELSRQLRELFTSNELYEARIDGRRVKILSELPQGAEIKFSQLNEFEILSAQGIKVPLKYFGKWKQSIEYKQIAHRDSVREEVFYIKFDSAITHQEEFKNNSNELIQPLRDQYKSHKFMLESSDDSEKESKAWAIKIATVCILSVLLVIALTLGSATQPIIVGVPILFGLIGTILALYIHGMPIGLMALIGIIGMVGVSVNSSLVMVDDINKHHKDYNKDDSILMGAKSRLRPIILTTLTTVAGVFPMAYSLGGESGFLQPLAFAMGWGLLTSTVLTLYLVPAFMKIRNDLGIIVNKIFKLKA